MSSISQTGKGRRLTRLFSQSSGKTVIVPVDDSLIFGPTAGLENVRTKVDSILLDPPDALLGFAGVFLASGISTSRVAAVVNITGSTVRSRHTHKVQIASVQHAAQMGADAVAAHVNVSSDYEPEMLQTLGRIAMECEAHGIPLMAIMYPRGERELADNNYDELKQNDRNRYCSFVAHAARVGVDLGADIIKTQYTGDAETFARVVEACDPIPVVAAGGPPQPLAAVLQMASEIINAGGGGVSFGRNVFSRKSPESVLSALKSIVHDGLSPDVVLKRLNDASVSEE